MPREELLASVATEQVRIEVAVGDAVGVADCDAVGVSVGSGPELSVPDETANPPMIRVSTTSPEPDPIRTSLRYGNLSDNLANWLDS
ncbi:unannotated protein [freshwater metagenome]|uniref:Unannotated protein n=1 Tax=freshwater metagenome TaxID=449393 RepID=A0A6J6JE95_9ZZZZ